MSASPAIHDCLFFGNHAGIRSGAVYRDTSSAIVSGNSFENDGAPYGGVASCTGTSSASITNNDFISNAASISGGAIACRAAAPLLEGNRFTGNEATNDGGAEFCDQASAPFISANILHGNTTGDNGGAIGPLQSSPTVEHNLLRANQAVLGGGAYCDNFSAGPIRSTRSMKTALSRVPGRRSAHEFLGGADPQQHHREQPLGHSDRDQERLGADDLLRVFLQQRSGGTRGRRARSMEERISR